MVQTPGASGLFEFSIDAPRPFLALPFNLGRDHFAVPRQPPHLLSEKGCPISPDNHGAGGGHNVPMPVSAVSPGVCFVKRPRRGDSILVAVPKSITTQQAPLRGLVQFLGQGKSALLCRPGIASPFCLLGCAP
jgi:hypothetical protein